MRVSREQMAANRARILKEASRLFRDRGFEAVTVADVMKASGQTHGGFYGHFASKDDLIAATLAHMLAVDETAIADVEGWTDTYLSALHRENPGLGCPMASLAGSLRHQHGEARTAMSRGLAKHIDRIARSLPGTGDAERRRVAIGRWSAMVGALVLARAVDDPALADELLSETRAWISAGRAVADVDHAEAAGA